ncbi:ROK family transcriptional regulator [Oribacterium sp. WCC10]|uniref:ROK family transcriptional regulator n=1 Tax=Oribacterium sp. WCC10 TaxID=1855343 RepID=UPI0008ED08B9|nr:ROK family transcriptional regulator [Oribacterium sp. WCC10]SFG63292.1 Sugar kinase of the NBD/HSP70 family, may contain an N-terminal HTH domain [Oribacterium sp. WCC10]
MKYSGINSNDVKSENRSKIIRLLNDKGDMARKDIATELGLTAAAVTQISNELLEIGILKENGEMEEEAHVGRKKIRIGLDEDFTNILGICIERNQTVISINNLRGRCILKKAITTDTGTLPETYLQKIVDTVYELMDSISIGPDDFLGVGVTMPGYGLKENLRESDGNNIWDVPIPVKKMLERKLCLPVVVENNVNAFAMAELIYGAGREKGNFVFVKWGPGLGSSIAINNKVYSNQDGRTSELGHIIIDNHSHTLESVVSVGAITDKVRSMFSESVTPVLWEHFAGDIQRVEEQNIYEWCSFQDPGVESVLDGIMEMLAQALYNVSVVLSPDNIIYYGKLFDIDYIKSNFKNVFTRRYPMLDEDFVSRSTISDHEDSIGAVAIVFNDKILKLR